MKKETGGNAFPDGSTNEWGNATRGGMTLRDYFAIQILSGMLSSDIGKFKHEDSNEAVADAYLIADAMLEERNK